MPFPLRYAGLIALATVLAACNDSGGDGDDSTDPSSSDDTTTGDDSGSTTNPDFVRQVPDGDTAVTGDNAEGVTTSSLDTANVVVGKGMSGGGFQTPSIRGTTEPAPSSSIVRSVRAFFERTRNETNSNALSTRATTTGETVPCDSGNYTYSYTYPEQGSELSEGAEWSLTFNDCALSGNTYSGSFTMAFQKDFPTGSDGKDYEGGWKLVYDDYQNRNSDDEVVWRAHGDMTLTFGQKTNDGSFQNSQTSNYFIISGDSLYIAYDNEVAQAKSYRMEYRIGAIGDLLFSYDAQASTSGTGGWVTVETTEAFEWSSSNPYPVLGELYVASGQRSDATTPAYVRLDATNGASDPVYYVNAGNGEGEPKTFQDWSNFVSNLTN